MIGRIGRCGWEIVVVLGLHLPKVGNNGGKKSMNISIKLSIRGRVLEITLAFRFFVYQYVIVYHLHVVDHNYSLLVIFLIGKVLLQTCIYTLPKYN